MKKIISLFQRNYDGDRQVRNEVVLGAEWVLAGEGMATEKYDGTCCLVDNRKLFKRYDAKRGRTPPAGFIAAQDPDLVTGHWPGWLAVGDGPEDRWHREGLDTLRALQTPSDGTYELVGPKIQGNPYGLRIHVLLRHGNPITAPEPDITFDSIRAYLESEHIEGIVWHHPDGRMVKVKSRDFGIRWPR